MKSNKLLVILVSFIILTLTLSVVSAGIINNSDVDVNDTPIKKINSNDVSVKELKSDTGDVKEIKSTKDKSDDLKETKNKTDSNTTIKETTLKLEMSSSNDLIIANLKEGSHNLEDEEIIFTIEKDGKSFNKKVKTDEEGIAELDIGNFSSGEYHVTALFKGNDNYSNSSDDIDFNISKTPTKLSLFKDNKVVSAKLVDNSSNPLSNKKVIFIIEDSNGKIVNDKIVSTNANGIATMDLPNLSEGNYIVKAVFKGNKELDSSYSNSITFTISKIKTYIKIIPDIFSESFVSAILFDESGNPLANKVLTFKITKFDQTVITKNVNTNNNGFASVGGINLTGASVSVSFAGDNKYSSSANNFNFESLNLNSNNITNSSLNATNNMTDEGLLAYLLGLLGLANLSETFDGLVSYLNNVINEISAFLNNIINEISVFLNNLISQISALINKIIGMIISLINSIINTLVSLLIDLLKFLEDLFNIDLSGLINDINALITIVSIIGAVIVIILVVVVLYVFRKL